MQTISLGDALASFNDGRKRFLDALQGAPPAALSYLKAGDDYSLGGLAVHVSFVIEHYSNVLDAMVAADFRECRPADPEGLEKAAIAKAKRSLSAEDVRAS